MHRFLYALCLSLLGLAGNAAIPRGSLAAEAYYEEPPATDPNTARLAYTAKENHVIVGMIDGKNVFADSPPGRLFPLEGATQDMYLRVSAGTHTLRLRVFQQTLEGGERSDAVEMQVAFVAGHSYYPLARTSPAEKQPSFGPKAVTATFSLRDLQAAAPPAPVPSTVIHLHEAVAQGMVSAEVTAIGGSTGDTIQVSVKRLRKDALHGDLAPGTVFRSTSATVQDMVGSRVKGERAGATAYSPLATIDLFDDQVHTYVVEAYCMDFHKANPAPGDKFRMDAPSPDLGSMLAGASGRSIQQVQAAVWIARDGIADGELSARFPVSAADLAAARRWLVEIRSGGHPAPASSGPPVQPPAPTAQPHSAPTSATSAAAVAGAPGVTVVCKDQTPVRYGVPLTAGEASALRGDVSAGALKFQFAWHTGTLSIQKAESHDKADVLDSAPNAFGGTDITNLVANDKSKMLSVQVLAHIRKGARVVDTGSLVLSDATGKVMRPIGVDVWPNALRGVEDFGKIDSGLLILDSSDDLETGSFMVLGNSRMPSGLIVFRAETGSKRESLPIRLLFHLDALHGQYVLRETSPEDAKPGSDSELRTGPKASPGNSERAEWLRKMDTNGDGRVSRDEFTGTDQEWQSLDANHDGWITPEEVVGETQAVWIRILAERRVITEEEMGDLIGAFGAMVTLGVLRFTTESKAEYQTLRVDREGSHIKLDEFLKLYGQPDSRAPAAKMESYAQVYMYGPLGVVVTGGTSNTGSGEGRVLSNAMCAAVPLWFQLHKLRNGSYPPGVVISGLEDLDIPGWKKPVPR